MPLKPLKLKERIDRLDAFEKWRLLKRRVPEAEPTIKQDANEAGMYALHRLKHRWPEAEAKIMKGDMATAYAYQIIKGRWPEAEPYIMKNPSQAWSYAMNVLKRPWPEAEPYIKKDRDNWMMYQYHVLKKQ